MITDKIILASASPRRSLLLKSKGVNFTVKVSDADESVDKGISPSVAVMEISKRKAEAVYNESEDKQATVIAADTVVALGDNIFGKPKDEAEAYEHLKSLSAKAHSVFTGVTIIKNGVRDTFFAESKVYFKELTDDDIYSYIATKEPMDKAGSYAIQGEGRRLIEKYEGDYDNIVGLPTDEVIKKLK